MALSNVSTADGVIIASIGGTVIVTTIDRIKSDTNSRGPTMVVVIGGVLVAVVLLILADFEPKLAAIFAILIFTGEFVASDASKTVLQVIDNVLQIQPGTLSIGANAPTSTGNQITLKSAVTSTAPTGAVATVIDAAMGMIGMPYSENPDGTHTVDCSLFVQKAYAAAGIPIPRTTFEQVKAGAAVALPNIQPGDLIFEKGLTPSGQWVDYGHVVMYLGQGQIIQAAHTGTNVAIGPMPSSSSIQAIRRYTGTTV